MGGLGARQLLHPAPVQLPVHHLHVCALAGVRSVPHHGAGAQCGARKATSVPCAELVHIRDESIHQYWLTTLLVCYQCCNAISQGPRILLWALDQGRNSRDINPGLQGDSGELGLRKKIAAVLQIPSVIDVQALVVQRYTWLTEYNRLAGHGAVVSHWQIYYVALYWSAMTMSTM